MVDALIGEAHRHGGAAGDAAPGGRDRRRELLDPVDVVGHAAIDLVAEPGEHRDGRPGDGQGDALVVEGGQVGAGATPADDDDGVERSAGEGAHGTGDGGRRVLALHPDVDVGDPEPDAAALQLVEHVVPGGAPPAGHEADAQRNQREAEGGVAV